jgi:hypothetical protein
LDACSSTPTRESEARFYPAITVSSCISTHTIDRQALPPNTGSTWWSAGMVISTETAFSAYPDPGTNRKAHQAPRPAHQAKAAMEPTDRPPVGDVKPIGHRHWHAGPRKGGPHVGRRNHHDEAPPQQPACRVGEGGYSSPRRVVLISFNARPTCSHGAKTLTGGRLAGDGSSSDLLTICRLCRRACMGATFIRNSEKVPPSARSGLIRNIHSQGRIRENVN